MEESWFLAASGGRDRMAAHRLGTAGKEIGLWVSMVFIRERMSIRSILGRSTIRYPLSTEMRRQADIPKTWKKGMIQMTAAFPAPSIPIQVSDWRTRETILKGVR